MVKEGLLNEGTCAGLWKKAKGNNRSKCTLPFYNISGMLLRTVHKLCLSVNKTTLWDCILYVPLLYMRKLSYIVVESLGYSHSQAVCSQNENLGGQLPDLSPLLTSRASMSSESGEMTMGQQQDAFRKISVAELVVQYKPCSRNWFKDSVMNIGQCEGDDFKRHIKVIQLLSRGGKESLNILQFLLRGCKPSFLRPVLTGRPGWLTPIWNVNTHKLLTTGAPGSLIFLSTIYETWILLVFSLIHYFSLHLFSASLKPTLVISSLRQRGGIGSWIMEKAWWKSGYQCLLIVGLGVN